MRYAPSIAFDYRPAGAIVALASVIVVAAVSAPWASAVPIWLKAEISIAAMAYGSVSVRRYLTADFKRIAYRATGWVLVDDTGTEHSADLASHMRYGDWIALDFRLDRRRRFRALVGPSNADTETRRRLILLLSRAEVVQPT
jgi:hypothetical protein